MKKDTFFLLLIVFVANNYHFAYGQGYGGRQQPVPSGYGSPGPSQGPSEQQNYGQPQLQPKDPPASHGRLNTHQCQSQTDCGYQEKCERVCFSNFPSGEEIGCKLTCVSQEDAQSTTQRHTYPPQTAPPPPPTPAPAPTGHYNKISCQYDSGCHYNQYCDSKSKVCECDVGYRVDPQKPSSCVASYSQQQLQGPPPANHYGAASSADTATQFFKTPSNANSQGGYGQPSYQPNEQRPSTGYQQPASAPPAPSGGALGYGGTPAAKEEYQPQGQAAQYTPPRYIPYSTAPAPSYGSAATENQRPSEGYGGGALGTQSSNRYPRSPTFENDPADSETKESERRAKNRCENDEQCAPLGQKCCTEVTCTIYRRCSEENVCKFECFP